jgi:tRNA(Ile)-lysidine synthetase-like protein
VGGRGGTTPPPPPAALVPGSSVDFCGRRYRADLIPGAVWHKTNAAATEAWLGLSTIEPVPTITLRHPARGDRMRPFGMAGGVLLSDLFSAQRVPREQRARALVAEVDGSIAWVCPGRSSESFRVSAGTPYTLHVREEET